MAAKLRNVLRMKCACLLLGGATLILPLASCYRGLIPECPELLLPTLGITCDGAESAPMEG